MIEDIKILAGAVGFNRSFSTMTYDYENHLLISNN